MKTSSKIALLVLLVVAGAAAFLALNRPVVSPAAEAENRSPVPVHSYSADTRPTVEVYGDSIAVADSPNFAGAESGPSSWTSY
ncbi:SGNH/GDSL hydrolase family protein, partial [Xanthomonas citri pv. citri]|nr:SGNH/GDSL hydrolase family protein [Xanthomonas citri pv. citri]